EKAFGVRAATDEKLLAAQINADTKRDTTRMHEETMKWMRDVNLGLKHDVQQNQLENQTINRMASIRGDSSMAHIEAQRDAAIQAYNTIDQIKSEGRMPSQIEYYDILGQMWKARTG